MRFVEMVHERIQSCARRQAPSQSRLWSHHNPGSTSLLVHLPIGFQVQCLHRGGLALRRRQNHRVCRDIFSLQEPWNTWMFVHYDIRFCLKREVRCGMSQQLYEKALERIPGGVHSPVRAFKQVGGAPRYWQSAKGAYLVDSDHQMVLDYVLGFGPHVLGHSHPEIVEAVRSQAGKAMVFGGCHEAEIAYAELIRRMMPGMEKVRLMNSGTEAVMTAIRLARYLRGKQKIVRFKGHYHGHVDALMARPSAIKKSDAAKESAQEDVTVAFNDLKGFQALLETQGHEVAAVILEPIAGNMGCILPEEGFLQGVEACCRKHGVIFILDEVMTGFRVALGGAQSIYKLRPDITVLGKVIGGGLPVGAIGGRAEIMDCLAPLGPVYQAGTFASNPMTVAAGLAMLTLLNAKGEDLYQQLGSVANRVCDGLEQAAAQYDLTLQTPRCGGMFGVFFSDVTVKNEADGQKGGHVARYRRFFHAMLAQGVYFPPSPFEACFLSSMHQEAEIQLTLQAAHHAFAVVAKNPCMSHA